MSDEKKPSNRGGYRPGAGRPKGSKTKRIQIDPQGSTKRLEELGFDPVEATVKMFFEVEKKIAEMEANPKTSTMAIASLVNTKEKLINNLMRYGYRPVPDKTEVEQSTFTFGVDLTDTATEDFEPASETEDSEGDSPTPLH
jgi:hypothetical protein